MAFVLRVPSLTGLNLILSYFPGLTSWANYVPPIRGWVPVTRIATISPSINSRELCLLLLSFARSHLFRFLVERRGHNFGPHALPANLDQQFRPDFAHFDRHVRKGNVFLEKWRRRAAGHVSGFPALNIQDAVTIASDSTLNHLQTDQGSFNARHSRLFQSFAAYKLRLVHFAEAIESCLPDIYRIGYFVS